MMESKIEKTPYFWYDIGSKVFLFSVLSSEG